MILKLKMYPKCPVFKGFSSGPSRKKYNLVTVFFVKEGPPVFEALIYKDFRPPRARDTALITMLNGEIIIFRYRSATCSVSPASAAQGQSA